MAPAADETTRLLRIARRKSDDGRRQLLAICGDLLSGSSTVLAGAEYTAMRDILARLVAALAVPLQRNLAEQVAVTAPDKADAVVASFTSETIDIRQPLLHGIDTVIGLDLVETIRNRAFEHRLMLAMRRSQADSGDGPAGEDAIDALLRSSDPAVPELVMAYLVEQSRRFDPFLEPAVRPEELSPALRHTLTLWLLAGLRHHLQQHQAIDATRLDDAVEAVAAAARKAAATPSGDAAMALARHLGAQGAITPPLMLQILRQGEVTLFIALLAELAGLRIDLARRMVFEPGGDGLAVLCRAIGLGRSVLASLFLLTRRARPARHASGPAELTQLLGFYDGIDPAVAREVLVRWRRDRDFLTALRFIEEASAGETGEEWSPVPLAPVSHGIADADIATKGWNG